MFKLNNYSTFVNSRVVKSKNLIMFHVIQNKKNRKVDDINVALLGGGTL
jgi:hypothetical protein